MASNSKRMVRYYACAILLSLCQAGCSSIGGYPRNPYNVDADLTAFVANSGPAAINEYLISPTSLRADLRNRIIYSRLAAYDIEYQAFQGDLLKESNVGNVASDLVVLGLNGAGATAGGAALKATLAAASAGVVGARASISKELFFDKAIPAILSQMSASRSAQLLLIQRSLQLSDKSYPLQSALIDANAYREAGSLPTAINILTANINAAKFDVKAAQVALTFREIDGASLEGGRMSGSGGSRNRREASTTGGSVALLRNLP